jgi:phosphatidylglycerophosphate synthase
MIALAPGLVLIAYFVGALAVFAWRTRSGLVVDAEIARRAASPLLGRYLRQYLVWVLSPWERALVRLRVSPNAITFASLVTAAASACAIARGWLALGGWLYHLTGILDVLDGRVARATGRVSRAGAFFDSVMDRYAELVIFAGLAVCYRSSWVLGLALAASLGSVMVSYVRARGEALGVEGGAVGTMQRPERVFYLATALVLAPLVSPLLVVAVLALLAVTANWTAIARVRHTLRALDARAAVERAAPSATPVVPMRRASRWN